MHSLWLLRILSFVAGGFIPLSFAPYNFYPIAALSLALLCYCFAKSDYADSRLQGYLFGLGMFGVGLFWVRISIHLFGEVALAGAIALTGLLVAFLALFPFLLGWWLKRSALPLPVVLLVGLPGGWTLLEWVRSLVPLGFPWLSIGYSQIDSPLSGYAPLIGVFGVTWLTVTTAGAITAAILCSRRVAFSALCGVLIVWGAGAWLRHVAWTKVHDEPITVALVQGGIGQHMNWQPEQLPRIMRHYMQLTEPYWGSDLIVWPEAALPTTRRVVTEYVSALDQRGKEEGSTILTGILTTDGDDRYYNSVLALGLGHGTYHKRHLVPFGEYIPWEPILLPLMQRLHLPLPAFTAAPGTKPILWAGQTPIGMSICYEDIFGSEVRQAMPEAMLLVNVSNDSWFGDSVAPHQHLQMARFRALENGRFMVRSTNDGLSAVIDTKGRVVAALPQFMPYAMQYVVDRHTGTTPYGKTGDLVIVVFLMGLLGLMYLIGRRGSN